MVISERDMQTTVPRTSGSKHPEYKMKLIFLLVIAMMIIGGGGAAAQVPFDAAKLDVLPPGSGNKQLWNYMHALAASLPPSGAPPATPDDWERRKQIVRSTVMDFLGIAALRKTPLNPKITDVITKPGYEIEKIVIESRPGFYLTGNLWKPAGAAGRLPVLLWVHGHNDKGKAGYGWPQLALPKKGIMVFAFDGVGFGERVNVNHYTNAACWTVGTSTLGFEIWDDIRAIDYLLTRDDVDPARIAVGGRSGGGTQSLYMLAVEPRIRAAVVMAGMSTLQKAYIQRASGHCICNYTLGPLRSVTAADMLATGAPHVNTLVIQGGLDPLFPIDGTKESFSFAEKIYKLYGKKNNISMFSDAGQHDATERQKALTVKFLMKALTPDNKDFSMPQYEELDPVELNAGLPSGNQDTLDICAASAAELKTARDAEHERFTTDPAAVRKRIIENILGGFPKLPPPGALIVDSFDADGFTVENLLLETEPGLKLPVNIYVPKNAAGRMPATILLLGGGKARAADYFGDKPEFNIADEMKAGRIVAAPDLRGLGELAPGPNGRLEVNRQYLEYELATGAALIGRPLAGMRAFDIIRLLDYLAARGDVDPAAVGALADSAAANSVLLAAALDTRIAAGPDSEVRISNPFISYFIPALTTDYSMEIYVPGILKEADVAELAALVAPRRLTVAGGTSPDLKPADADALDAAFSFTRETYARLGAESSFRIAR